MHALVSLRPCSAPPPPLQHLPAHPPTYLAKSFSARNAQIFGLLGDKPQLSEYTLDCTDTLMSITSTISTFPGHFVVLIVPAGGVVHCMAPATDVYPSVHVHDPALHVPCPEQVTVLQVKGPFDQQI
jgi:hypothetical protein